MTGTARRPLNHPGFARRAGPPKHGPPWTARRRRARIRSGSANGPCRWASTISTATRTRRRRCATSPASWAVRQTACGSGPTGRAVTRAPKAAATPPGPLAIAAPHGPTAGADRDRGAGQDLRQAQAMVHVVARNGGRHRPVRVGTMRSWRARRKPAYILRHAVPVSSTMDSVSSRRRRRPITGARAGAPSEPFAHPSPLRGGSERGAPPPAPRARSGRNR